jgi:hypothetical protein
MSEELKARALALYAPPFTYSMGYIHDSKHKMVADDHLPTPEHLESGMALRVRGWGHIQKHEDPAALQDEVGRITAEALTEYWEGEEVVKALENDPGFQERAAKANERFRRIAAGEPADPVKEAMAEALRNFEKSIFIILGHGDRCDSIPFKDLHEDIQDARVKAMEALRAYQEEKAPKGLNTEQIEALKDRIRSEEKAS